MTRVFVCCENDADCHRPCPEHPWRREKQSMFYQIMCKDLPPVGQPVLWWSQELGWTTRDHATRYETWEKDLCALPRDGRWVGPCDGTET